MKLLLIANGNFHSTYGGGQVYVRNLVDEMINQHIDVNVISISNRAETVYESAYKGIRLYTISTNNADDIKALIKNINPDLMHIHSAKALMIVIARELHIATVVTAHHGGILCSTGALLNDRDEICSCRAGHDNCLPCALKRIKGGRLAYPLLKHIPRSLLIRMGKLLQRWPFLYFITPIGSVAFFIDKKQEEWSTIATGVNTMIAPSGAIAAAMQRNGLSGDKIVILPHGIPSLSSSGLHRRSVILPSFFYVGRICHEKGLHILLEAFSGVQYPCELHIVGNAESKDARKYLRRLQHTYRYIKGLHWHGKIASADICEKIAAWDVLIHPSICLDVYGLNIAEALSMGKPVISTRCGGAEMQVVGSYNGLLVPTGSVTELREAINYFCERPEDWPRMSRNAIASVTGISAHVDQLLHVYKMTIA